jgi:hypothetical protein
MAGVKVVAIRKGFFGGKLQLPGVEFTISNESQLGSWMKVVKVEPEKVKPKAKSKSKPVKVEAKAKE